MAREIRINWRGFLGFVVLLICWSPSQVSAQHINLRDPSLTTTPPRASLVVGLPTSVTTYEPLSYLTVKDKVTDCAVDNCIALTFDDGPDPQTTVEILRILREKQVKATFFVVGNRVVQHPEILRQMHADGHEVGNHSWDHANMTRLNDAQIRDQVSQTQAAVRDAGLPTPEYFRPPYLARNERVQRAVNLPMILWNNDPEDWRKKRPEQLGDSVRDQAKSGGIVLLHDTKELTVRTLPAILDSLCKDYHCVTINQLLDMPLDVHHEFTSR